MTSVSMPGADEQPLRVTTTSRPPTAAVPAESVPLRLTGVPTRTAFGDAERVSVVGAGCGAETVMVSLCEIAGWTPVASTDTTYVVVDPAGTLSVNLAEPNASVTRSGSAVETPSPCRRTCTVTPAGLSLPE